MHNYRYGHFLRQPLLETYHHHTLPKLQTRGLSSLHVRYLVSMLFRHRMSTQLPQILPRSSPHNLRRRTAQSSPLDLQRLRYLLTQPKRQ